MSDTNENYFRKWLDDPVVITPGPTAQETAAPEVPDTNITYYKRYLNDSQNA